MSREEIMPKAGWFNQLPEDVKNQLVAACAELERAADEYAGTDFGKNVVGARIGKYTRIVLDLVPFSPSGVETWEDRKDFATSLAYSIMDKQRAQGENQSS